MDTNESSISKPETVQMDMESSSPHTNIMVEDVSDQEQSLVHSASKHCRFWFWSSDETFRVIIGSMLTPRLIDEPASPSKQEKEFGDFPLEIMANIIEILHSEEDKAIMFGGSVAST